MMSPESPAVIKTYQDLNEQYAFYETQFIKPARSFEWSFNANNYTDDHTTIRQAHRLRDR